MVDTLTPSERSRRMSLIRSRDTRPEMLLRRALHRSGFRYRLNDSSLPGKPDIVLKRHGVAILVHGCFWHRHRGCSVANRPKSNRAFWDKKFKRNVERDKEVRRALGELGWRVLVVWECELKTQVMVQAQVARLLEMTAAQVRQSGGGEP